MKFSENQILTHPKYGEFKILKIKNSTCILIEFLESKCRYIIDESALISKKFCDYKSDEQKFLKEEHLQNSGDIIIVLERCLEKQKEHIVYKCVFKESLNIIYSQKYKILNGLLRDKKEQEFVNSEYNNLYAKWLGIKKRCFDKNFVDYKNYGEKGVTICEEWLDFENFKRWYKENKYEDRLSIDKDILANINHIDKKEYSPNSCILIHSDINCWLGGDNYLSGVTKLENNKFKAKYKGKYLGIFSTFREAKNIYAENKKKDWILLIERFKMPSYIKEILLKYDFTWYWLD